MTPRECLEIAARAFANLEKESPDLAVVASELLFQAAQGCARAKKAASALENRCGVLGCPCMGST